MTDKPATLLKPPVSLLAQLDGVFVFQTKAFANTANNNDPYTSVAKSQQLLKQGQTSYGELNLGLHVNDDSIQVLTNRMRLLTAINEQLGKQHSSKQSSLIHSLHWVNQVHGKQIHDIDNTTDNAANNTKLRMRPLDADAMISKQAQIGLAVMTADCVPIVLYQPATKQIAAIHAGWQGLARGVIKATTECFASNEPIIAWIGTCISQANYEVDKQVLDQLWAGCRDQQLLNSASLRDFEPLFSRPSITDVEIDTDTDVGAAIMTNIDNEIGYQINNNDLHKSIDKLSNYATLSTDKIYSDKVKLNLPKLAAAQLEGLGVQVANDAAMNCSYEDTSYYSYRRQTHLQQPATGRMALIIVRSH